MIVTLTQALVAKRESRRQRLLEEVH